MKITIVAILKNILLYEKLKKTIIRIFSKKITI